MRVKVRQCASAPVRQCASALVPFGASLATNVVSFVRNLCLCLSLQTRAVPVTKTSPLGGRSQLPLRRQRALCWARFQEYLEGAGHSRVREAHGAGDGPWGRHGNTAYTACGMTHTLMPRGQSPAQMPNESSHLPTFRCVVAPKREHMRRHDSA